MQIVNHFDLNQCLTSKYGLCRNIKNLAMSEQCDFTEFYPRCYDLGDQQDFQDFIEDFKYSKTESMLLDFENRAEEMEHFSGKYRFRIRLCLFIQMRRSLSLPELLHQVLFKDDYSHLVHPGEWLALVRDKEKKKDKLVQDALEAVLDEAGFEDCAEQDFARVYRPRVREFLDSKQSDRQFSLNAQRNVWIVKPECTF